MGLLAWLLGETRERSNPSDDSQSSTHSEGISSSKSAVFMRHKSDFNVRLQASLQNTKDVIRFSFEDLKAAGGITLGAGGFGKVVKGCLDINGRKENVAIKIRDKHSEQGDTEFFTEIATMGAVDHPNILKLVGFAADNDERALVYEYMPGGTLESHIHGKRKSLDWHGRMSIAAGIARGLKHLHKEVEPPIIHCDVKPPNILLTARYTPKLADFGLAEEGVKEEGKTVFVPNPGGTKFYAAPELGSKWITSKCDVYSFGVSLFELIMGKKPWQFMRGGFYTRPYLPQSAMEDIRDEWKCVQLADRNLEGKFSRTDLQQALSIAFSCLHEEPNKRPTMDQVEQALSSLEYKAATVLMEEDYYWLLFAFWQ